MMNPMNASNVFPSNQQSLETLEYAVVFTGYLTELLQSSSREKGIAHLTHGNAWYPLFSMILR